MRPCKLQHTKIKNPLQTVLPFGKVRGLISLFTLLKSTANPNLSVTVL